MRTKTRYKNSAKSTSSHVPQVLLWAYHGFALFQFLSLNDPSLPVKRTVTSGRACEGIWFLIWITWTPNFDVAIAPWCDQARLIVMWSITEHLSRFASAAWAQISCLQDILRSIRFQKPQRKPWAFHIQQLNVMNCPIKWVWTFNWKLNRTVVCRPDGWSIKKQEVTRLTGEEWSS